MLSVLHKYLALHKKLNIPGIGNFVVTETPATLQFTDKQLQPPASHISFTSVVHPTNNHFYSFLSKEWNVDKVIAIRMYKEEVEQLLDNLKKLGMCELHGIGIMRKTSDGSLSFATANTESISLFAPVTAERVLRKGTQHTVLVGEQEHLKTMPEDAEELYNAEDQKKEKWWIYALILALIAVVMIVYYYIAK